MTTAGYVQATPEAASPGPPPGTSTRLPDRSATVGRALAVSSLATLAAVTLSPASAGAAQSASTRQAEPVEMVEHCITTALTDEQVEEGQTSVIDCTWEPAPLAASALSSILLASHWDGANGTGARLDVLRGQCAGSSLVLGSTSWNNRISSTTHLACGNVKHFDGGSFDGTEQLTSGGPGAVRNMNSSLNNAVSSVRYGD